MRDLAAEVRAELARQDLQQKDLAERIGKPPQTINRWIRGSGLDYAALQLVAEALGVSATEIMQRARFRCTQPPLADSVPAQVRRLHSGATPYRGPLRRASDQRQ
jgi:transcriptional regulator with XRE-family HTH domain